MPTTHAQRRAIVATHAEVLPRFFSKVNKTDTCWLWTGARTGAKPSLSRSYRYGVFSFNGGPVYAHRFAYEALIGPIGPGLTIDHLCRVHECVNPAHLEVVSHAENMRRADQRERHAQRDKTHCPRGHPYDSRNTYRYQNRSDMQVRRHCKECRRQQVRAHRRAVHA